MITREERTADVVVVGAGAAGLATADRLHADGHDVVVLEGRDRVGGRVAVGEVAGVPVDLGAAFVGPGQDEVASLVHRFGLGTAPVYHTGRHVQVFGGRRRTYRGTIPKLSPVALADYARVAWALDRVLAKVRVASPWLSDDAERLDAMSLAGWVRSCRARPSTQELFRIVSNILWGCSPEEISLLQAARHLKGAGGLDAVLDVENGAQQDRVVGSFHDIPRLLAQGLEQRVLLDTPVRRIRSGPDGVTVESDRYTVRAQFVVVAVPPSMREQIQFDPGLPPKHSALTHHWRTAALSKVFLGYPTPFWRAQGLSGSAVLDRGPVFLTFDMSPADGPGVLMAFVDPMEFDALDAGERRLRVLRQVEDLFGAQARTPVDYLDHCWSQETFAAGGPGPLVPPRGWTLHGSVLREPVGRIHWAGSETADEFSGYVEGALRSGRRAAEEVLVRLRARQSAAVAV